MSKTNIKDLTLTQLTKFVVSLQLKPFRARQIFSWLYRPHITCFSQMTDISKEVRLLLATKAYFNCLNVITEEKSTDGTIKYGFLLDDGAVIESVLIPDDDERRHTLCLSSQVGCAMKCGFCLTGVMGLKRNLQPAEIVGQVSAVLNKISATQENMPQKQINNLVFMGMGEPLLNFDNVISAIHILLEQHGHNFSSRRLTLSTCGIIPQIKKLGESVPVNLAVSLHGADDETRSRLMPINNRYPVDKLLTVCRHFPLPPRRKIMIEYMLIKDINDSLAHAKKLVTKLHGISCKINLLPYNQNEILPYQRSSDERVAIFQKTLRNAGLITLIRNSRGDDISAACGQLIVGG